MAEKTDTTRRVLAMSQDVRDATIDVVRTARRSLSILTHDLEPSIYDRIEFLDAIKHLILTSRYVKIRILLMSPVRMIEEGHRLVELLRRFNSFIEIRRVHPDHSDREDAFLIADEVGLVYRLNAARWEGVADPQSPQLARKYLAVFDEIWNKSATENESRRLHL